MDIGITDIAMGYVRNKFQEVGHRPNMELYAALSDIPRTVENILLGKAKPAMYVCGLDVGVGKTTTLKGTIQAMRSRLAPIGIVLCLGRYEQIETAIADLADVIGSDYAVLAARGARSKSGFLFSEIGKGAENINEASVLFTTHAQMELRLQHIPSWQEASAFFYEGKARPIRIWDEACSFRRHFSISRDELHQIAGSHSPRDVKEYAQLMLDTLRGVKPGSLIALPEAGDLPERIEDVLSGLTDAEYKSLSEPIRNLVSLSGKQHAGVRQSEGKPAMIQFDLRLPNDLLPLIVLDASAQDRVLYDEGVEDVVPLRHAEKRYDNVTIHVRNGNSGARAFWNNYADRLKEAADIIKEHPNRKVLIIHPKEKIRWQRDMVRTGIEAALGANHGRHIQYLHWGIHDAVNDYADCNLVICLTLYHLPRYVYEIMGRAYANVRLTKAYENVRISAIEAADIRTTLRQGLGRSCIRKLEGNQAQECLIYVTVPTKSAVKHFFKPMFPGCKVGNVEGRLDRKEQVIDYLNRYRGERVFYDEMYRELDIDQGNFTRLIKSMRTELGQLGWEVKRSRPSYFQRMNKKVA